MKKPLGASKIFRAVRVAAAHLMLLFAVLIITFFIIDRFNTAMEFMTSELSKWMIFVLAALALLNAVFTIAATWVRPEKKEKEKQGDRI